MIITSLLKIYNIMCAFPIEIRKGTFPLFNKATVRIGKSSFVLRSGEIKNIEIADPGTIDIEVNSYWVTCKERVTIDENKRIVFIKYALPNWYFFIGAFVLIPLSILALIGIVKPVYLNVPLLIFYLPLMYFAFLNPNKYFKITAT